MLSNQIEDELCIPDPEHELSLQSNKPKYVTILVRLNKNSEQNFADLLLCSSIVDNNSMPTS